MKIDEIYSLPSRDEFVRSYQKYFSDVAHTLLLSTGLELRQARSHDQIHVGVFDGDQLISYVGLHKHQDWYQIDMQCTDPAYRGQGYVRRSIEFVTSMLGCVISDVGQTPEAQRVWQALIKHPNLYHYYLFDLKTQLRTPMNSQSGVITPNPWDETDQKVIMVCDRRLTQSSQRRLSDRDQWRRSHGLRDEWLGAGFTEFNP